MSEHASEAGPSTAPRRRRSASSSSSSAGRRRSGLVRALSAQSTRSDSSNVSSGSAKVDWDSGDAYDYVQGNDEISAFLHCPICLGPFYEPVGSVRCSHTFCKLCITTALAEAGPDGEQDEGAPSRSRATRCPSCRTEVGLDDFRPTALLIKNMVDTLLVRCPNRAKGCGHTCERHLVRGHVARECEYEYVDADLHQGKRCGCRAKVMRKDWQRHALVCPKRKVDCETCREQVPADELERHCQTCSPEPASCWHCGTESTRSRLPLHLDECPELPVPCRHAQFGCDWRGPRWQLEAEAETTADASIYHLTSCRYEPLKAFFTIFARQTSELRRENDSLRQRLQEVEGRQRSCDRRVDDCVHSLGSWYRPAEQASDHGDVAPALTLQGLHRFDLDGGGHGAGPRPPQHGSSATSAPDQPVPTLEDRRSTTESAATLRWPSPMFAGTGSGRTTAPATDHRTTPVYSPPPTSRSAPSSTNIDIPPPSLLSPPDTMPRHPASSRHPPTTPPLAETTLSGLLASLQDSIGALFDALTSLERRYEDSHLTAVSASFEAARATEETASLRHVVHAVRMQIHQILMTQQRVALFSPPAYVGQNQAEAASAGSAPRGSASEAAPTPSHPGPPPPPACSPPMLVRRWAGFDQTKL
ncbi:uncharacterized protein PFL1_00341 [Pseudozyma flocculosa PF-1]|uniref:RING-type domain-containing protein n=1 Tax=Pseudozyma flocculosa TaxID=84751 RepID=A0A5C3ETR9_9BASI|nr:uncharacterized protein PFL1_00341 [Pseudozyma flocculosa PF-1]EPQ32144.1 hypothetical protein PFL1_00341 [Pseudozyma flocculosa PF-1]SPO34917.1 uncharacterized protein PSFLO_00388 [Pseudozyma flocculosa]